MPNIFVKSYGCSANTADAEIAKGALVQEGYTLVDAPEDADLNIIVTCVVKTPTEQKVSRELKELEASGKPLIVAGCMPKSMNKQVLELVPTASLVGPDDIERMPEAVQNTLDGNKVVFRAPTEGGAFRLFVYVTDTHGNGAYANMPFEAK